jgi:hypothetical protein
MPATKLDVAYSPPPTGGRPKIFGTVLSGGDEQWVTVRLLASLPEDAGGSGSPRVEIWFALARSNYAPTLVRRATKNGVGDWEPVSPSDLTGSVWASEIIERLDRMGYRLPDLYPGDPNAPWARSTMDRRTILPDDDRWPKSANPSVAAAIRELQARRNTCPDDEVWRIDAMILGLCLRA